MSDVRYQHRINKSVRAMEVAIEIAGDNATEFARLLKDHWILAGDCRCVVCLFVNELRI